MPHLPPSRQGVSASVVVLPSGPWSCVLDFLVQRFPAVSAEQWRERMQAGLVQDERGQAISQDSPFQARSRLYYYRDVPDEPRIPFVEAVLFEDEHLVVADKPHFLPVTPGGRFVQECLLARLQRRLGVQQLQPLHRIDRDTAGLVLFAKQPHERGPYHELFRQRQVYKRYEAIAPWRAELQGPLERCSRIVPASEFFRQREVAGLANAHTRLGSERISERLARYQLEPRTGQRHQLRVHLAALGAPILNDPLYPVIARGAHDVDDHNAPLQLLARAIAFTDPITGTQRAFESGRTLNHC